MLCSIKGILEEACRSSYIHSARKSSYRHTNRLTENETEYILVKTEISLGLEQELFIPPSLYTCWSEPKQHLNQYFFRFNLRWSCLPCCWLFFTTVIADVGIIHLILYQDDSAIILPSLPSRLTWTFLMVVVFLNISGWHECCYSLPQAGSCYSRDNLRSHWPVREGSFLTWDLHWHRAGAGSSQVTVLHSTRYGF